MSWISLALEVSAAHAESLSDALLSRGALSVSVEDADAGTSAERPLFGEPGATAQPIWERSVIRVLCAPEALPAELLAAASADCGIESPPFIVEQLPEQDWVRITQAQFAPLQISPRLWIVPSWHELPDPTAITLRLDPGLAFGTGSHPTTRLCLRWLEERVRPGAAVLDYGCGSGILAIAAAKLGAEPVLGVDIDPAAVAQARINAHSNAVRVDFLGTDGALSFTADLVVANILAMPLKILAPLLASHCRPGGRIVLAGLLDEQSDEVAAVYEEWFETAVYAREEGWTALTGTRR